MEKSLGNIKWKKIQYKLVGGDIENNEEPILAFKCEVLEEAGCEIDIVKKLGIIEEYRSFLNLKQISHVFVSNVVNNINTLNLTEKEMEKMKWDTLIQKNYTKLN